MTQFKLLGIILWRHNLRSHLTQTLESEVQLLNHERQGVLSQQVLEVGSRVIVIYSDVDNSSALLRGDVGKDLVVQDITAGVGHRLLQLRHIEALSRSEHGSEQDDSLLLG